MKELKEIITKLEGIRLSLDLNRTHIEDQRKLIDALFTEIRRAERRDQALSQEICHCNDLIKADGSKYEKKIDELESEIRETRYLCDLLAIITKKFTYKGSVGTCNPLAIGRGGVNYASRAELQNEGYKCAGMIDNGNTEIWIKEDDEVFIKKERQK